MHSIYFGIQFYAFNFMHSVLFISIHRILFCTSETLSDGHWGLNEALMGNDREEAREDPRTVGECSKQLKVSIWIEVDNPSPNTDSHLSQSATAWDLCLPWNRYLITKNSLTFYRSPTFYSWLWLLCIWYS